MLDPVLCDDGHSYERAAITRHLADGNRRSPVDNSLLTNRLIPNVALRSVIGMFLLNGAHNDLSDEVRRAATNARILARRAAMAARRAARRHSNE